MHQWPGRPQQSAGKGLTAPRTAPPSSAQAKVLYTPRSGLAAEGRAAPGRRAPLLTQQSGAPAQRARTAPRRGRSGRARRCLRRQPAPQATLLRQRARPLLRRSAGRMPRRRATRRVPRPKQLIQGSEGARSFGMVCLGT